MYNDAELKKQRDLQQSVKQKSIYEYQFRSDPTKKWSEPTQQDEIQPWSDGSGKKIVTKKTVFPNWEWQENSSWKLSHTMGWVYADNLEDTWFQKAMPTSLIRRRKWVRPGLVVSDLGKFDLILEEVDFHRNSQNNLFAAFSTFFKPTTATTATNKRHFNSAARYNLLE